MYFWKTVKSLWTTIIDTLSIRILKKQNTLFGTKKISIPTIASTTKAHKPFTKSKEPDADFIIAPTPAFPNEQVWFEMQKSTGRSRNILDLSKLGKIEEGSVVGTPYEYFNQSKCTAVSNFLTYILMILLKKKTSPLTIQVKIT